MQEDSAKKFYVTTPIYYVTARPHLGSLYSTLLADVADRWHKLQGQKTFFLTGTDEHGQKIAQAAQAAGKDPQTFVDGFIDSYKDVWHHYNLAYTYFIRTTDRNHTAAVQQWIRDLQKKGDIYKSFYSGWYCTPCETYLTEASSESSKGPLCPTCGRETSFISEESYFFKLSAYQERLLQFYKENPNFITPKERLNEVISFVQAGLKDLSISRTTLTWGIPFPDDLAHVVYVWADALNNYITAIGYGQPDRQKEFNFWWPADLQVLGKDIVRFHAVFWPAFLMASGLALPKRLLVHGWIKVGGQKMSKSLGNVIDPEELYKIFGADPVRYYLTRYMAITQDSSFSDDDLRKSIESDLANDLGNLLNRVLTLAIKNNMQEVQPQTVWTESSLALRTECWDVIDDYANYMEDCMFHLALARLWKFINNVNAYFHAHEPWKLAKSDKVLFAEVISAACHSLYTIGYLLWPIMPATMEQLLKHIGVSLLLTSNQLEQLKSNRWDRRFVLMLTQPLFEKHSKEVTEEKSSMKPESTEELPGITIDDLSKIYLVVGTIEQCGPVEKSDKLYVLQVNFGTKGKRQILSGIKQQYKPDELIGQQSIFVLNLKPRMMMGLESHGMMMLAKEEDGTLRLIFPSAHVADGTRLQ